MTISYPLNLPTSSGITEIIITQVSGTRTARSSVTDKLYTQRGDGGYWKARVSLPYVFRDEGAEWIGFLASLDGQYGSFYLGDSTATTPLGTALGTPLVKGASQTGFSIITDGWTINQTGCLKSGDYIQIGSYLYIITKDADSDAGGNSTLDIWPRLRTSPADNEGIITTNTKGIFRLTDSEISLFSADGDKVYSISFNAEEAI